MLWSRRSGTSFLVGASAFPSTPLAYSTLSLFSSLFAATKNFPSHIGIVSSASMVMYGMSPIFFSFFASSIFTEPNSGLDLTSYLIFLALVGGTVNLFGACVLTAPNGHAVLETADGESEATIDETTSLLSGLRKHDEEVRVIAVQEPNEVSFAELLKDPHFWVLFVFMSLTVGWVSALVFPRKWL